MIYLFLYKNTKHLALILFHQFELLFHAESPKESHFFLRGLLKHYLNLDREVIKEEDLELDRLSKMALNDPSTEGNPKKLTENDMKILYQHSMSGKLF